MSNLKRASREELLMIFGLALKAKFMEKPTRHQIPGRHFGRHHGCHRLPHPPGTKLVRGFIRGSWRESTANRQLYAYMTGHQYSGTSK